MRVPPPLYEKQPHPENPDLEGKAHKGIIDRKTGLPLLAWHPIPVAATKADNTAKQAYSKFLSNVPESHKKLVETAFNKISKHPYRHFRIITDRSGGHPFPRLRHLSAAMRGLAGATFDYSNPDKLRLIVDKRHGEVGGDHGDIWDFDKTGSVVHVGKYDSDNNRIIPYTPKDMKKSDAHLVLRLIKSLGAKNTLRILKKAEEQDYRIQHRAPDSEGNAPLHDLKNTYPEDIYTHGAQYYGHGVPYDHSAIGVLRQVRGKPEAKVKIYRAVPKFKTNAEKVNELVAHKAHILKTGRLPSSAWPKSLGEWSNSSEYYDFADKMINALKERPEVEIPKVKINPGDWVTTTKEYAKEHGEGVHGKGNYKILSMVVPAKHVFTDGNSIHEYGYDPGTPKPKKMKKSSLLNKARNDYKTSGYGFYSLKNPKDPKWALEKGLKGDWQKEGYDIVHDYHPNKGSHSISAYDKEGNKVGGMWFYEHNDGSLRTTSGSQVWVNDKDRRKGIASAMYQLGESKTGKKFKQGNTTPAGSKVWSQPNRSFGKSSAGYFHKLEKEAAPNIQSNEAEESKSKIRSIADSYARKRGFKLTHGLPQVKINPEIASKVAGAYMDMKHDPSHPVVQKAYSALISEASDQFQHMLDHGFKFSKMTENMKNPYASSKDLFRDLSTNHHLWYFPTEAGFGSGENSPDHPLLAPTKFKDSSGKPLLANDVFRMVHDYFGHGKEHYSFGPNGEESAYRAHRQMFSPLAQLALASETRGQNSTVNFGSNAAHNLANPGNTIFAEQKAGILPKWAREEY